MKKDWYELNIEEPLRGLVKHLRNNGVNTTISCAHEMYINCSWSSLHCIRDLESLVFNYLSGTKGRDAINFGIEAEVRAIFGEMEYPPIRINLYLPKEQKAFLLKERRRLTRKGIKQMTPKQIRALPAETRTKLLRVNKLLYELKGIEK